MVHAAPNLLVGEFREPAFNEIDPGSTGRSEVQVIAGSLGQPTLDGRSLVGGVVVEDDVNVQILRNNGIKTQLRLARRYLWP